MADRTVAVKLVADIGGFQSGMTKASAATRGLGGDFDKTQQQADRGLRSISQGAGMLTSTIKTAGAALGGLAVVSFLRDSIGAASDLNETLNKSNVIFGDNAAKIEKWSQGSAKNFGLSRQAALDAASGFGNMLTQLGYTGDAATEASTDVVGLAADLGSFNNLETGDVLDRISAAMRGEYDSLQLLIPNINAARVEQEAMATTGKKNKDELTAQEKAAAVLAIVHKDGAAAANDFAETQDGLANKTKIAAAQFEDLKSKVGQAFLPVAQNTMGFLSSTAIPALEGVFDTVMDLAGAFSDLPGPLQTGIAAFGLWMVAGGQIKGVLSGISGGLSPLKDTTRAFGEALDYARANGDGFGTVLRSVGDYAGGQALSAFKNLARAIGPELGIGLAVAGIGAMVSGYKSLHEASDEAKNAQHDLADALKESKGAMDDNVRSAAAKAAQDAGLLGLADDMGVKLSLVTDAVLGNKGAYDELMGASEAYLQQRLALTGGNTEDATFMAAADSVRGFKNNLNELAPTVAQTKTDQDQLAAATEQTGTAAAETVDPLAQYAAQLEGAAEAADAAKKQTDAFKLSLDILTGAHVSMIQVESAFQASLAEATGAMEGLDGKVVDTSGNLNLQSEAGRKASDVLLGVRDSGNELIAQMIAQGGTTDEVKAKDAELRDSFIHTAQQMGISKDAASLLADQILGIPAERQTTITADTDPAAVKIAALQAQIDGVAKDRNASINFRATLPDLNGSVSGSGRPGMADGGYTGPGAKYDPAPYQVHRGEIVWSQSDIAAHGGVSQVESMRRSRPMGYADGGVVGLTAYADTSNVSSGLSTFADLLGTAVSKAAQAYATPAAGSGSGMSGTWTSIAGIVQRAIPGARINSTYRPGDPGYHGRNKAVDFGFGSGPGGAGSAGLASIARFLYSGYGRSLAEIIYDGIGDNTPDVKNGQDHVYNAATRAEHRNHVHAAVYHAGTDYVPQTGWAYLEKGEAVIPAAVNSREFSGGGGFGGGSSSRTDARSYPLTIQTGPGVDQIVRAARDAQRDMEFLHG